MYSMQHAKYGSPEIECLQYCETTTLLTWTRVVHARWPRMASTRSRSKARNAWLKASLCAISSLLKDTSSSLTSRASLISSWMCSSCCARLRASSASNRSKWDVRSLCTWLLFLLPRQKPEIISSSVKKKKNTEEIHFKYVYLAVTVEQTLPKTLLWKTSTVSYQHAAAGSWILPVSKQQRRGSSEGPL